MSLGDFDTSSVVYFKFTTFRPSTGAPFTLAGTPALSVYKDSSTTQTTTGVTLTADFDSVTGLNHVAVDTSADGTFYAAGSFFDVVITTGTVDSVSAVGVVVGRFTLRKNSALKPTTAGRTLDVSAGGEAGIDFANIGSPTTTVNLSGTTISTSQTVASVTNRVTANTDQLAGQTVTAAAGVTFPTSVASPTNITSGTITTVGTVTNRVTANTDQWGGVTVTGMPLPTTSYTAPPTAAANASAVRTELTTELGRIDVATSTRFASSGVPANFSSLLINASGHVSRVTLTDTCTTNTDMRGTDSAALASAWTATRAGYLDSVLLSDDPAKRTVKVTGTGSGHIAADVHAFQPGVLDSTAFAAGAIDSNALAASAATEIATAVNTGQMTESYRAAGVAPTPAQALFELLAHMGDSSISGTTKTLKKLDGSAAKTFTLDSSTAPTSITEAT